MTMDSKATERISMENMDELKEKWAEETANDEIVQEGCIKVAITKDGECKISLGISNVMIMPILDAIEQADSEAFSSAAAAIAAKNLLKGFSGFLNDLAKASDDESEEADGDDDEDDSNSESEDGEMEETPECE